MTIPHKVKMIIKICNYDFTWIRDKDPNWKDQTTIPISHALAILTALFHYLMISSNLIWFLGGTYLGEFCDIDRIIDQLTAFDINPWIIAQYV